MKSLYKRAMKARYEFRNCYGKTGPSRDRTSRANKTRARRTLTRLFASDRY